MTVRLALIDYGAGNLSSVAKGLAAAGAEVSVPKHPAELSRSQGVVIPGVGHFAATSALGDEWRDAIRSATAAGLPLLGICLGLQWMFDGSDEASSVPGLGLFKGRCFQLSDRVKVPHVGWNTLEPTGQSSQLLTGLPPGSSAYFTHSFAAPPIDETTATATHGDVFAAVVECDRTFGVQFHPEKSGTIGLRVLSNFVALAARTSPRSAHA